MKLKFYKVEYNNKLHQFIAPEEGYVMMWFNQKGMYIPSYMVVEIDHLDKSYKIIDLTNKVTK